MENVKVARAGKRSFLKGAVWIAAGGFIAKIIGALYRIPLTNLIGGHGLGLYQLVYPVYCLLLTVSATGIPSSIAKLTADRIGRGQSTAPLLKTALKLFIGIGIFGSVFMAIIAPFLAQAQGSEEVLWGYYALSPSVALVAVISVFRGWFQGKNNMMPTAISEISEQIVKVGFGLLFAVIFQESVARAVVFLLLAVTFSELFTLFLMLSIYHKEPAPALLGGGGVQIKTVLKMSIPVTLNSLLIPLSSLLDSIFVPRLLSVYAGDAVTLYGLFSGGAVTVVGLPVSVCYGVAAASIPAVAEAFASRENGKGGRNGKVWYAFFVTVLIALPSALLLYFFAEPAAKIIYRSLSEAELSVLIRLIKIFSVSAFTLSCAQTLAACLTAKGKPQLAALNMLIGIIVKTAVYFVLLRNPKISVFGLAHATNLCYLVAFLLDLLYNLIVRKSKKVKA